MFQCWRIGHAIISQLPRFNLINGEMEKKGKDDEILFNLQLGKVTGSKLGEMETVGGGCNGGGWKEDSRSPRLLTGLIAAESISSIDSFPCSISQKRNPPPPPTSSSRSRSILMAVLTSAHTPLQIPKRILFNGPDNLNFHNHHTSFLFHNKLSDLFLFFCTRFSLSLSLSLCECVFIYFCFWKQLIRWLGASRRSTYRTERNTTVWPGYGRSATPRDSPSSNHYQSFFNKTGKHFFF